MVPPQFLQFAWVACGVLFGVWAVLLVRQRFAHRYPLVTAFFVIEFLQVSTGYVITLVPQLGIRSPWYGWFWMLSKPLTWTLFFCVFVEIYKQMLTGYDGLRRLGTLALYAGLASSLVLVVALAFLAPPTETRTWISFWALQDRSVFTALTLLSLFLVGFAVYFRLRVSRDALVLLGVFGFLWGGEAALWLLRGYLGENFRAVRDVLSPLLVITGLSAGALLMMKVGEPEQIGVLATADLRTTSLLSSQLKSLNETLQKWFRP